MTQPAGDVSVRGLAELQRNLARAETGVTDLRGAFAQLAATGAAIAAAAAPRRTGRLAASIRPVVRRNYAAVQAGGAGVPYAGVVNFGWRRHHVTPRRFMERADAAWQRQATPVIEAAIGRMLQERGLA